MVTILMMSAKRATLDLLKIRLFGSKDYNFCPTIWSYLKMFSMQCRKDPAVEDNKKKNEYSQLYEYMYKYIYLYYMRRE